MELVTTKLRTELPGNGRFQYLVNVPSSAQLVAFAPRILTLLVLSPVRFPYFLGGLVVFGIRGEAVLFRLAFASGGSFRGGRSLCKSYTEGAVF